MPGAARVPWVAPVSCLPMTSDSTANVPLSQLDPEEKAKRSGSFGAIAEHYERYRPGPGAEVVEWVLGGRTGLAVDLGAGTGALTRLLVDRVDEVVGVEPDDRMRAVLAQEVPGARAVVGKGEAIPLPDHCADAVMASSSWHWMDPEATLAEVARVLVPGGVLAVMWTGPNPDGPLMTQGRAMLSGSELGSEIAQDMDRPTPSLEIPAGAPFGPVERESFTWDIALTADDLIGLIGTLSWVITMEDERRERVLEEARRLLRQDMGLDGDATIDVEYRTDAWRTATVTT